MCMTRGARSPTWEPLCCPLSRFRRRGRPSGIRMALCLYKIFIHFNVFENEPIIIVLPLPPVRPTLLQ